MQDRAFCVVVLAGLGPGCKWWEKRWQESTWAWGLQVAGGCGFSLVTDTSKCCGEILIPCNLSVSELLKLQHYVYLELGTYGFSLAILHFLGKKFNFKGLLWINC